MSVAIVGCFQYVNKSSCKQHHTTSNDDGDCCTIVTCSCNGAQTDHFEEGGLAAGERGAAPDTALPLVAADRRRRVGIGELRCALLHGIRHTTMCTHSYHRDFRKFLHSYKHSMP